MPPTATGSAMPGSVYGGPITPSFGAGGTPAPSLPPATPRSAAPSPVIGTPIPGGQLPAGPIGTSPYAGVPRPPAGLFQRMFSQPASAPLPPIGSGVSPPLYSNDPYASVAPGPYSNPSIYNGPSYGGAPAFGSVPGAGYPNTAFPSGTPSTLFPGGLFAGGGMFPNGVDPALSAFRLFRGPRLRHTFVGFNNDDQPDDLETNDTDVSVVFQFPRFGYSTQPLYVAPSFSLHLWDGPQSSTGADLPSSAYSAFVDVGWNSDPLAMFSTEFGVRIGAFTDFDTFNSDSVRYMGKALAAFRLTPSSTFKLGAYYIDRNDIKLVPAVGWICRPSPFRKIDLFFPKPKYAAFLSTIGTRDLWYYITGEYGGGSWTIGRDGGGEESIDINDLRAIVGIEWGLSEEIRADRRTGFFEVGYVFDREIVYADNPANDLSLDDGVMFRLGIGY